MARDPKSLWLLPALMQTMLVLAGLAWLHLAPSSPGNILLIPLNGAARQHLAGLAVDSGAKLLGQGRWGGSIVVRAEGDFRFGHLLGAAVLPMAAPGWLCGGDSERKNRG